ncbi:MAG: PAS domain-containing protein [Nitrospirae bacterium]|nr:PAS domain-containing protein [Nitrospirota bacterium]
MTDKGGIKEELIAKLEECGLMEAVGVAVSIQGTDFKIMYQNQALKELNGEHAGEFCYKAYAQNESVCEGCALAECFRDGKIHKVEQETAAGGRALIVEVTASPIKNSAGEIVAGVEIIRDITEFKKTEEELRRAKDEIGKIVEERTAELESVAQFFHNEVIERKKIEQELRTSESKLQKQKSELENKNIALREIIKQIDIEKNKLRYDIEVNIKNTLLPILSRIQICDGSGRYYDLLKFHLGKLVSSFGREIAKEDFNLTAREIEICNMIKGGMRSKEICKLLNISFETVEKHRKNIRKKVGLSNRKTSLFSFLQKF